MAAAVAVERPNTAQERVLASNNPPPPPPVRPDPTHRQRAAANNRGTGVAGLFCGQPKPKEEEEAPPAPVPTKAPQASPSEFFSGPKDPGHVKHGVRRFEEAGTTVGLALTEEWIRGRKEGEPITLLPSKQSGPKGNLEGLCCSVKTEEAKHRPLRAPGLPPAQSAGAPFSEPELPSAPPAADTHTGKRQFKARTTAALSHHYDEAAPDAAPVDDRPRGTVRTRRNRANESVDVLNLGQYTREDLHEVERKIVSGPRKFTPESLPPRRRPIIARRKTAANETHDIFGTGQGTDSACPIHRKNPGTSAPRRCGADLFNPQPEEVKPMKPYHPSMLLSYDVSRPATADGPRKGGERAAAAAAGAAPESCAPRKAPQKAEPGTLFVSKSESYEPRGGRGRGVYAPKSSGKFF
ncbi:hypothetical protein DQ04_16601000 [Trypanosoma grayi]|uniref:hypothetical protein n=1 Tax=Trypanosoma grayi TaxID=71804 RepID=UPI0004F42D27|nr:hypothetical protein DQ04_16601000 [Trypanosoma grayi]KEG06007.1 hypothetical protein DQ04_16601000 [Trypanosoma grayi]